MQKYLGVGVGLRRQHFDQAVESYEGDWFELISENFMTFGGRPRKTLERLKSHYPLICHGVGLSLGSLDDFNEDYLSKLSDLLSFCDSPWFSDHLCISSSMNHQYHDLLPILRTEETVANIVDRIKRIQDFFQRPFAIENISFYSENKFNQLSEIEFINQILDKSDCLLLLDINNVYVNEKNLGINSLDFLHSLPSERVVQIHLAGHDDSGEVIIDTHGDEVCDDVWTLYEKYLKTIGRPISTLIEWDNNIPSFHKLNLEVVKAKTIISKLGFGNES